MITALRKYLLRRRLGRAWILLIDASWHLLDESASPIPGGEPASPTTGVSEALKLLARARVQIDAERREIG